MDHFGIEKAMLGIGGRAGSSAPTRTARSQEHPDRFFCSYEVDPNRGMEGVRDLVRAYDEFGVKAATAFPAGHVPQVPINDKKFYPLYAKCIELDIPICVTPACPGRGCRCCARRRRAASTRCAGSSPSCKFVMRHGCEPWADLAVKLMLKWPNLYYSTSRRSRRSTTRRTIIDFANTRGADKVMYAGYFPMGLSLERIFKEMPDVPFRDHVWPKFLRENAVKVFNL